jgi:hypothetical protein
MAMAINTGAPVARGQFAWFKALLFLTGLTLGGFAAHTLSAMPWGAIATHFQARDWVAADATVATVGLEELSGAGGKSELTLQVGYSYGIDGAIHEGRRVSLFDSGAIDDRRLKVLYARLNFARVTGRTVTVFVDPADPATALVDRDIPWRQTLAGAGLALTLLGSCFGCLVVAFRHQKSAV